MLFRLFALVISRTRRATAKTRREKKMSECADAVMIAYVVIRGNVRQLPRRNFRKKITSTRTSGSNFQGWFERTADVRENVRSQKVRSFGGHRTDVLRTFVDIFPFGESLIYNRRFLIVISSQRIRCRSPFGIKETLRSNANLLLCGSRLITHSGSLPSDLSTKKGLKLKFDHSRQGRARAFEVESESIG